MKKQDNIGLQDNMSYQKSKKITDKVERKNLLRKYISSMNEETRFKFWIKTLLSSYSNFPEIIRTLDKIIELQASTVSFSNDVFNGTNSLECQVEQVIDLTQRKTAILNIYIMTRELLKVLPEIDLDFIEKKFVYNWSVEDLSKEYNFSPRTIYRKIDKLIDIIYKNGIDHHWTLRFIESQTSKEHWLKERYYKCISDYFKNSNYQNSEEKTIE